MKKLLLSCMIAIGIGASAQILVNESFEGTSLPTGWTVNSSTYQGFGTSAGQPCAGAKSIYYNLWSSAATWNLTYSSTVSNGGGLTYSFKYLSKPYDSSASISGTVAADYSVDGGTTWVDILAPVAISGTALIPCTTVSGSIPAGTIPTGANFKIRLKGARTSPGDFYLGFDDVQLSQPVTNPPSCTTVSAPVSAATGVSVTPTISWAAAGGATSYTLNIGTVAGGTDIVNGLDVGGVTTYSIPSATPLNYSTQYYITIIPTNSLGAASGCTSSSFTTRNIVCPTVSAPTNGAVGQSLTPTITWGAVTTATGYKLNVGTTPGGVDVLSNQDVGNVTTYTFSTPLSTGGTYYYTVNSYNATSVSASCTERSFSTICGATNVPYTQDFESVTTPALPACTALENAGTGNNWTTYSSAGGGFSTKVLNYSYNSTNAANAWFYTQGINLTAGTSYRIKYIYGNASGTSYPEKLKVAYGTSATSAGMTTVLADYPNITNGTTAVAELIDFTPTTSGVYYFGFNAYSIANMNRLYVDNISITATPACTEPSALTSSNITTSAATISWTAPATAPNSYEYAFTTTNVAPASGTTTNATTANLGPLTPQTAYYAWVRSNCSGGNSSWIQVAFTTLALPPANDDCSSATNLIAGNNFAQNVLVGTTNGATNTPALTASCLSTPTNVAGNVWYKVTVPASGSITVETDAVTGSALTDTVMSIFADCTSTTSIVCDDDTGNGNFSKISLTGQVPGTILYVSVWRYSSAGSGSDGQFQVSAYDASLATSEVSNSKNYLKVYPNPFADVLNISDISKVKSVSVSDIAGRLVKTIVNPSSALQLGELKSGMYLITLEMKDGSKQTIKTIKK